MPLVLSERLRFAAPALEQPILPDVVIRWRAVTEDADKSEKREGVF
jgi:hypothetical protein